MASEPEPSVQLINVSNAIIFAPLIVVGVLVLLASWLKILDLWSWLSDKVEEYRARRGNDDAHAPNVENGMVENRVVENRVMYNGPQRGEGAGSNNEERLRPPKAFTEQRVWWALDLSH